MYDNIARLDGRLLVISSVVGAPAYDFDFNLNFACEHPHRFRPGEGCVLRIGPISDYGAEAAQLADLGLRLINSIEQHRRASDIEGWYPLLPEITAKTIVFEKLPEAEVIEAEFGWPVFVKGARQTSKHDPKLAIARGPDEFIALRRTYRTDKILSWQKAAVRSFISLDAVPGSVPGKIQPSREFRTFWWNGTLVGHGQYWYQLPKYEARDLDDGLALAQTAAHAVDVPFLVVDIAKRRDGGWIVIECNDAQESGYAGVPPRMLWRNILDHV